MCPTSPTDLLARTSSSLLEICIPLTMPDLSKDKLFKECWAMKFWDLPMVHLPLYGL